MKRGAMNLRIRIAASVVERLRGYHLAPGKRAEALSYIWAQAMPTSDGVQVLVPHTAPLKLFAPDCFNRQSAGNVQLAPDVLNGMLVGFAGSPFNCLINVHDHWFAEYTRFSGIDDRDDEIFDDYLRKSFEPMLVRHPGIGHARNIFNLSIVMARKGVDARLVDIRRNPRFVPATMLDVVGDRIEHIVIGAPANAPQIDEMFSRQKDFIPADRQALLSEMNAVLAGCGGLGSILAEGLARVGVGGLVLIDDDRLDPSNLNRWQGGRPDMVGQPKTEVLAANLRRMFPKLRVQVARKSLYDPSVEASLAEADVLVAGLDNDEARYFLNRVSVQYGVPYFDAGIAVTGRGDTLDFRARYFAVFPGTTACAECTQFELLDRAGVVEAFLDEATAQSQRNAGYVSEMPQAAAPSVYALNQRAASLLVTEFLNHVCGWRAAATTISESWRDGTFRRADRSNFPEGPDPECPVCSYYAGSGSSEPLPRPRSFRRSALRCAEHSLPF